MTQQNLFEQTMTDEEGLIYKLKHRLLNKADVGTVCPCCNQFIKRYRRTIHYQMAHELIQFYKHTRMKPHNFFNAYDLLKENGVLVRCGDFAKLRYWELIEEYVYTNNPKKKHSGQWRLTSPGRAFIHSEVRLPKYAVVLNGVCESLEGDFVFIKECLRNKFNYADLMNNI